MSHRGFTLIETIIYLALFSMIMSGILYSAYGLIESSDRNQTKATLQEEKEFLVGKINYALSGMQSVSTPAANTSSASLSVRHYDGTTYALALLGNDMLYNGTVLNNSNTKITNLVFIHTYAGGINPERIEAGFTIAAATATGFVVTQNASTTRYLWK